MARHRDAVTGQMVTKDEARRRPRETVRETGYSTRLAGIEKRLDRLERAIVLGEAGARELFNSETQETP